MAETTNTNENGNCDNRVLSAGFYITDFCKCKCGEEVSPSQADTVNQILYDDNTAATGVSTITNFTNKTIPFSFSTTKTNFNLSFVKI